MWALSCATISGLRFVASFVKCFCNNKNVLRAQSMVRHFVRHSLYTLCVCSLSYPARNAHALCYIVICVLSGYTIFYYSLLLDAESTLGL